MRLEVDLLCRLLPYEAPECPEEFIEHSDSVAVDVEIVTHRCGTEIQSETAIVPTGDGDVVAIEHLRVALAGGGRHLDEGVVFDAVVRQHTLVTLANLRDAVDAEMGFYVDTEVGVVEQACACGAGVVLFFRPDAVLSNIIRHIDQRCVD